MMKQWLQCCFRWVTLLLVPVLIGAGCAWLGIEVPTPEPMRPLRSPSPEPVITPTTAPDSAQESVLYEDDFADPASGWPNELVFDNYYIGYHEPEFYPSKSMRPMLGRWLLCQSRALVTLSLRLRCS